jgi:hypothetical protein
VPDRKSIGGECVFAPSPCTDACPLLDEISAVPVAMPCDVGSAAGLTVRWLVEDMVSLLG